MSLSFNRWKLLSVLLFLAAFLFFFPTLASAWHVNWANAHLARALALPLDAPDRSAALMRAAAEIATAREVGAARAFAPIPARFTLAQARLFALRGEFSQAVDALESASDSIAQFVAGDAAYRAGDAARAFTYWRAAGAGEYFVRNAYRALDKHLWREAEDHARVAAGIAPDSAPAWYALADALAQHALRVNDANALDALNRAEALTQDQELLSTIISRRGEIFAEQGKSHEALAEFARATNIAPLDARPRVGAALVMVQSDPDARLAAIELLKQALADAPWYSAAYRAGAHFAETARELAEAERWLQSGLEKNPNNPELLYELGMFYARQNRADDARVALILALKYEQQGDDLLKIQRALTELDK